MRISVVFSLCSPHHLIKSQLDPSPSIINAFRSVNLDGWMDIYSCSPNLSNITVYISITPPPLPPPSTTPHQPPAPPNLQFHGPASCWRISSLYTHVNMWLLCTWLTSLTNMRRRCHLAGCNYKQCSTFERLLRHYERQHSHINGVSIRCVAETCGFSTKYIKRLREHVDSHHTHKERWKIQQKVYESQLFHVQNIGIIGAFFI